MTDLLIPLNAEKVPFIPWRLRRSEATAPQDIERINYNRMETYAHAAMWARVIPPGSVVLDVDDGAPMDWITQTRRTPRGYHYEFTTTRTFTKRSTQIQGRKVDICPAGSLQIILGPRRELLVDIPPAELPEGLIQQPAPRGVVSVARSAYTPSYIRATMDKLFWLVARTPEGRRNITLNMAAYRLSQLGVPLEKARGTLTRAAVRAGLREPEISRTIASAYYALGCRLVARTSARPSGSWKTPML